MSERIVQSRFKLFSDPVHGFISVPRNLILNLIEAPVFQRLRRIRQLGLGFLAFPGAVHTRFEHALGAMALMQDVLSTLREKGVDISEEEYSGALTAALLHDIGHGPFSHTLENSLIYPSVSGRRFYHEQMSRALILHLNNQMDGVLDLALRMFDNSYERGFFHTLVSSQLDMDRLDYLRRDSYFTGVAEGVVGVDRILKTMRVIKTDESPQGRVVIEAKGAYAIENFILSRRLMYWQVYLHKTVLAADQLLHAALVRARKNIVAGKIPPGTSPSLAFFLENKVTADNLDEQDVIRHFVSLDDTDVLYSLKRWRESDDPILSDLADRLIDRRLFRTTFLKDNVDNTQLDELKARVVQWLIDSGLSKEAEATEDAAYYLAHSTIRHDAYQHHTDVIAILERDGTLRELSEAESIASVSALSGMEQKSYVCLPKEIGV